MEKGGGIRTTQETTYRNASVKGEKPHMSKVMDKGPDLVSNTMRKGRDKRKVVKGGSFIGPKLQEEDLRAQPGPRSFGFLETRGTG